MKQSVLKAGSYVSLLANTFHYFFTNRKYPDIIIPDETLLFKSSLGPCPPPVSNYIIVKKGNMC